MLDIPMIDSIGDMLELGVMAMNIPPKALAAEIGYSVDALYLAFKGERSIPVKARIKLSSKNLIMACAVALEGTGLSNIFGYQNVDRHIQSMIIRVKAKNKEVDNLVNELPIMLLDKNSIDDLTEDELNQVRDIAMKVLEGLNCSLNLAMELDSRYSLELTDDLKKKKRLCGNTDVLKS
jgi:plasmid maintenance system antidote protein VapI